VKKAFDSVAMQYDKLIRLWVPWYDELTQITINNLACKSNYPCILDLGCGTGNLSSAILDIYPKAEIHVVDVSSQMIDLCKSQLTRKSNQIYYYTKDLSNLDFNESTFDFVMSQITIHQLDSFSKKQLFLNVYKWLKPEGLFSYSDIFCGSTPDINEKLISKWKNISFQLGANIEQWNFFIDHYQQYDRPISLMTAFNWLWEVGFEYVDVTWRQSLWSNIVAVKPRNT